MFQGGLTFLAVKRYRQGIQEDFSQPTPYGDPNMGPGAGGGMPEPSPYGQYAGGSAGETGDPYQSPFGSQAPPSTHKQDDFHPPTY